MHPIEMFGRAALPLASCVSTADRTWHVWQKLSVRVDSVCRRVEDRISVDPL